MLNTLLLVRPRFPWPGVLLVLALAALVLGAAALLRSTEYDENYSVFVTGGDARPDWPTAVFTPAEVRRPFTAHTDAATTARLLRETDVHPPLYFWALGAWRGVAGDGLPALRGLSLLFSLGALLLWMAAAWRAALPPLATGLVLTLAYGFGYSGHIARGFALAHLLVALSALAALQAWRAEEEEPGRTAPSWCLLAGLAGGLASFTNYLAVFPVAAVLAWLVLRMPGWLPRFRAALLAGLPFLLVLGGDLYFFLAQKGSRNDQFEAFALVPALLRLAQFNAANLFGALPLYVGGVARAAVGGFLALLLLLSVLAVAWQLRRLGPTRWLWVLGAVAPSAGLLLLGAAFANMPVELRYVAFAAPFIAVLIAGTAAALAGTAPRAAALGLGVFLAVQAAGALGMVLHPASQQPFRPAMAAVAPQLGEGSVLLIPFGNDGVGITGTLLREAPPAQKVLVLRTADAAAAPARAAGFRRVVLMGIGEREGKAQVQAAADALAADPDWRSQGVVWRDPRGHYAEVFERQ